MSIFEKFCKTVTTTRGSVAQMVLASSLALTGCGDFSNEDQREKWNLSSQNQQEETQEFVFELTGGHSEDLLEKAEKQKIYKCAEISNGTGTNTGELCLEKPEDKLTVKIAVVVSYKVGKKLKKKSKTVKLGYKGNVKFNIDQKAKSISVALKLVSVDGNEVSPPGNPGVKPKPPIAKPVPPIDLPDCGSRGSEACFYPMPNLPDCEGQLLEGCVEHPIGRPDEVISL